MQLDFLRFLTGALDKDKSALPTQPDEPLHLPKSVQPVEVEPPPSPPTASAPATARLSGRDAILEERASDILTGIGLQDLAKIVKVSWNTQMRSTAGTACSSKAMVTLNPAICRFGTEEIDRTFLHELAHLVALARAGKRRIAAHGPEWKKACTDLGIPGESRCHTLPLPRRSMQRRYSYRCLGCKTIVKRARAFRGKAACLACCKKYNRGKYDERFRFVSTTSGE